MSRADAFFGSRRVPQLAALALISFGVAGCSADMSSRLSNPFNYQGDATGTVPQAAPASGADRASRAAAIFPSAQCCLAAAGGLGPADLSDGRRVRRRTRACLLHPAGPGTAPAQPRLETTASVPPRSVAAARPAGNTTIIVGTSDTLEILAQRYHATPAAILAANGYKGPRTLSPDNP